MTTATCKRFADGEIAADAQVTTDGHAGYNDKSLGERPHERESADQSRAARERRRAGLSLDGLAR